MSSLVNFLRYAGLKSGLGCKIPSLTIRFFSCFMRSNVSFDALSFFSNSAVFFWIVLFSKKDCFSSAVRSLIYLAMSRSSTGLYMGFRLLGLPTSVFNSFVTNGFSIACFCCSV
jgi:hypothetical protein